MVKNSIAVSTFKAMRPVHWIKNLSLFAAIFLSGMLFDKGEFTKVVWAFIVFCLITSATYIVNDIMDAPSDKLHPTKKFRPIASGDLPIPIAVVEALILTLSGIFVATLSGLNSLFVSVVIIYLILQFFYSTILKNVAIIDIIVIAAGFVLRVYAGAFAGCRANGSAR